MLVTEESAVTSHDISGQARGLVAQSQIILLQVEFPDNNIDPVADRARTL